MVTIVTYANFCVICLLFCSGFCYHSQHEFSFIVHTLLSICWSFLYGSVNSFHIAVFIQLQTLPKVTESFIWQRLSPMRTFSAFILLFIYESMCIMPGTGRLQVPQPAVFLQHPSEPPVPFSTWISAFDAYLHLVELERGEALTASTKNSLLFSLLGQEGLRQFGNDPIVATIAAVGARWSCFFRKRLYALALCEKAHPSIFRIVFISKKSRGLMLKHTDTSGKKSSFRHRFRSIKPRWLAAKAVMRERAA